MKMEMWSLWDVQAHKCSLAIGGWRIYLLEDVDVRLKFTHIRRG